MTVAIISRLIPLEPFTYGQGLDDPWRAFTALFAYNQIPVPATRS